jgi:hypothetical protein
MVKIINKKYRKQEIESTSNKTNSPRFNHTKLVEIKVENEQTEVKETKKTKNSENKKNENTKQDGQN